MTKIIQDWLGTRLGVLLDTTPQVFGKNTKDGKLLAKLLYSYGVIPLQVLEKIHSCSTCYGCYDNLSRLKPWLTYIGVTHDDTALQKMASGEGSAAVSVFYSVYLNLERKDRLRYISAQKERRSIDGTCNRFQVELVPEKALREDSLERGSVLAMPLVEKRDIIDLHRAKCKEVVEKIKKAKKGFQKIKRKEAKLKPVISKSVTSQPLEERKLEAEKTAEDIDKFTKKHPEPCADLDYDQLVELKNRLGNAGCAVPSLSEAKAIMSNIRRRKKGEVYAQNFQQKMQKILLDEQWKQIVEKQDRNFEDTVCANLLKQSQYEKQMASKLHLIKYQKKVIAENRRKLECLKVEQEQKEYDDMLQEKLEQRWECYEEAEFEKERVAELHRRLYEVKARTRNAFIREDSRKICEALVDIAIRIGEIREMTGCQIPKAFMKDLKELFYKGLSIFDILDHYEELCKGNNVQEGVEVECFGEDGYPYLSQMDSYYDQLKCEESERQNALNECDLNDYLQLSGPWMVELLFPDNSETEEGNLVLGYIVHKLLAIKYPPKKPRSDVEIKPMKPVVVIQGLVDENALNMLIDLMELCRILVVRTEDAINFVLLAYKEEVSVVRDIDINFQKATFDSLQDRPSAKEKEESKKTQLLKKVLVEETVSEDEFSVADKQTQTPRMIPEDDPLLSPNAEIGKCAFEALGGGDAVPDLVLIAAITAYVKSKEDDYDGWVLINYPVLYSQARELEYSLVGCYALPVVDNMLTLEEAECFTHRGPWADCFAKDNFASRRESRLVPVPESSVAPPLDMAKTYFHRFIKMTRTSPASFNNSTGSEPEFDPLEAFYRQQDILRNFEYQNLNFQTLKNLGKVILDIESDSVSGAVSKTSVEYFGGEVLELNEKWEPKKKNGKETAGGAKKNPKDSVNPPPVVDVYEEAEEEEEVRKSVREPSEAPKPGESGWEWADGPQPNEYLVMLAGLWENMEAVYLEDFKNVFFCLRVHRANVLDYIKCIRQSVRTLMRRPDEKQRVLFEFQQMFNDLDPDLRPDVDIKCELHVRVSELEQALMAIADERKMNSQRDVTKVAQDGWVPDEMANLTNIYLTALQLEADRCVDSVQVIMDYYNLLQQKIPDEKQLEKIIVAKLQIQNRKYSVTNGGSKSAMSVSPWAVESKRGRFDQSKEKINKTRSLLDKRRRSSDGSILPGAAEVVTDILTRLKFPEDGLTPFHTFFIDNVDIVTSDVKSFLETCLGESKKSDKAPVNAARGGKSGKNASETKMAPVSGNMFAEWSAALEKEMSRFFFRVRLILARGIFEMNEFLTTILNILSCLSDDIGEMYAKEIRSISECCKVFRCSIEEEKSIQPILELRLDEFIVNLDGIFPSTDSVSPEDVGLNNFVFSLSDLSIVMSKLHAVAPEGEIIKRSLIYILEDLASLKSEVAPCRFTSLAWEELNMAWLMDKVYLDLEIVNWKDFIIYAMELPLPTDTDILNTRSNFRKYDPLITELISRECYDKVKFWFENSLRHSLLADRYEKAKNLLFEMYQVDETQTNYSALLLAFCKGDNPVNGFLKALTLAQGKKIVMGHGIGSSVEEDFGEYAQDDDFHVSPPAPSSESHEKRCTSSGASLTCIPKNRIRCTCPRSENSQSEGGVEDEKEEVVEQGGEDAAFFYGLPYQFDVSFVSFDILTSLLQASFPSLSQLSVLLDCGQTFQETLGSVYDSLEPINGKVEVGKLIRHKFIDNLLHSTNKFKFLDFGVVLRTNKSKYQLCSFDRLALTKCFHHKNEFSS